MVLLSVTEGEDKPLKYPSIFNTADVAVITKTGSRQGRGILVHGSACEYRMRPARHAGL